jgi:hypothetical protein
MMTLRMNLLMRKRRKTQWWGNRMFKCKIRLTLLLNLLETLWSRWNRRRCSRKTRYRKRHRMMNPRLKLEWVESEREARKRRKQSRNLTRRG